MYQLTLWELSIKGYRLHAKLLAAGEKPDMRPWGGRFDILNISLDNKSKLK